MIAKALKNICKRGAQKNCKEDCQKDDKLTTREVPNSSFNARIANICTRFENKSQTKIGRSVAKKIAK